jgi:hypothetical protein
MIMRAKKPNEKVIDQALEELFKTSPDFVAWFLARTKINVVDARYRWSRSNHPWGKAPMIVHDLQSGLRKTVIREGETDILVLLECANGLRFALHIENKITSPFTTLQPEMYAARAAHWIGSKKHGNYTKFKTILIAPQSFYAASEQDAQKFDAFVSYEDLALHIPIVREALSYSR